MARNISVLVDYVTMIFADFAPVHKNPTVEENLLTLSIYRIYVQYVALCTGGQHYALYRFLSISNKFCFQVYCTVYNLTALCKVLPHWGLKGAGGWTGPETSHVLNH